MKALLPPRQHELLLALCDHQKRFRRTPTIRALALLLGVRAAATIHKQMRALERKGLVARPHKRSRTLVVLRPFETITSARIERA